MAWACVCLQVPPVQGRCWACKWQWLECDGCLDTQDLYSHFGCRRQPNGEVVVTYGDDGNITSVKPLNTAPPSFAQSSSVLASWSTTGSGNATIFFVDGVIMSSSVYDEFINNSECMLTGGQLPHGVHELTR